MNSVVRTFIAIPLPEPQAEALARLQKRLSLELPKLRWTDSRHYHLTLAFLGDVRRGILDDLFTSVANAASEFSPIALELKGLGVFPHVRMPKVLWAGLEGEDLPRLLTLREQVAQAAGNAGAMPTDDRFHPHLTFGRFWDDRRERRHNDQLVKILGEQANWSGGTFFTTEVVVFSSVLKTSGPIYQPLSSAQLRLEERGFRADPPNDKIS
jgi:RNA 2',3'-cyclic 3'-phosphodiesterase